MLLYSSTLDLGNLAVLVQEHLDNWYSHWPTFVVPFEELLEQDISAYFTQRDEGIYIIDDAFDTREGIDADTQRIYQTLRNQISQRNLDYRFLLIDNNNPPQLVNGGFGHAVYNWTMNVEIRHDGRITDDQQRKFITFARHYKERTGNALFPYI